MKASAQTEAAICGVLDRFCRAVTARDWEAVTKLFAPDPDIVLVTSEGARLWGRDEVRAFHHAYADGPVTYSWTWDRRNVSCAGAVAWMLAEGTETAATETEAHAHPYRMTLVCEQRDQRWLLMQLHGSVPRHADRRCAGSLAQANGEMAGRSAVAMPAGFAAQVGRCGSSAMTYS